MEAIITMFPLTQLRVMHFPLPLDSHHKNRCSKEKSKPFRCCDVKSEKKNQIKYFLKKERRERERFVRPLKSKA